MTGSARNKINCCDLSPRALPRKLLPLAIAALATASQGSQAFEFDTGNPDLTLRWDNTVKYNLTVRAQDQDKSVLRDGAPLLGRTGLEGQQVHIEDRVAHRRRR